MSGCLKWIIILALLPFALYTLIYLVGIVSVLLFAVMQ